jgi:hypothetical protein
MQHITCTLNGLAAYVKMGCISFNKFNFTKHFLNILGFAGAEIVKYADSKAASQKCPNKM